MVVNAEIPSPSRSQARAPTEGTVAENAASQTGGKENVASLDGTPFVLGEEREMPGAKDAAPPPSSGVSPPLCQ